MKNKSLIIATTVLFITVNLKYFWEAKLGTLSFPAFIFFLLVFLILTIVLIFQIGKSVNENFNNRARNWTTGLMFIGLALIFLKPNGIIDFEKLEGKDLFIAQREGGGNCTITLKLKTNNKFKERTVCFGISEVKGNYEIRNDTIFFSNLNVLKSDNKYFQYATLKKSKYSNQKALFRYKNMTDTIGYELWVIKNEILK